MPREVAPAADVPRSRDELARARAALARVRLRRALARRGWLADAAAIAGALAPLAVAVGLFFVIGEPRALPDDPLVISLALLVLMGAIVAAMAAMLAFASGMILGGVVALFAPFYLVVGLIEAHRWWLRRAAERVLDRAGWVPAVWARANSARRRALAMLAAQDRALVFDPAEGLAPRPEGPAESCPQCGARRRLVGEGVRRCAHCEREAFTPLPPRTAELAEAQRRLAAVRQGGDAPRSRRDLWRAFVAAHGAEYRKSRRWALRFGAAYGVAALVAELGWTVQGLKALGFAGLIGIALLALPLFGASAQTVARWSDLRFARFRPGVRAYDRALVSEVVAVVAHQGRVALAALAAHLEVSRGHLEALLADLDRLGGAPILRDRERDELVSLCAADIGADGCPMCGGALVPAPRATIVCERCGTLGRAGGGHAAPYARLA